MTERQDVFRFLDLPAELRNCIYTLASTKPDSDESCVLPCISLTQVNRQIRSEYLPICMKAAVTIASRDLPKYLDTFYPTVKGQLENVEQAPSEITVIADKIHRNGEVVQIDCLPLIQMRHAHATFHCRFVHVVHVDDLDPELCDLYEFEKRPDWLSADSGVILSLIDHTHVEWLQAVSAGKVERIMIDFVGTPTVTTIEFYVYADEKARSSTQARKLEIDQTGRLQYFEEMGLTGIWQTAAGKDMY